jgi:hypothetical protein
VTRLNMSLARFAGEQALAGRHYEVSVQNRSL